MQSYLKPIILIICAVALTSCSGVQEDAEETNSTTELAQQLGDVMSSVDDATGGTGTFASAPSWMNEIKASEKYVQQMKNKTSLYSKAHLFGELIPQAMAASCIGYGFSGCTANAITRNFGDCTLGSANLSGAVVFTFSGPTQAACKLAATLDTATRNPNFTITKIGSSVSVSKTGAAGETLSYLSGSGVNKVLSFSSDGIRRLVTIDSVVKYSVTSSTVNSSSVSSPITVTGSNRSNRLLNGGTIRLQDNLSGERCHISPSAVTWSGGTCTCATSGVWSGTCESQGTFNLEITGCGTGKLTLNSVITDVTFNNCSTL